MDDDCIQYFPELLQSTYSNTMVLSEAEIIDITYLAWCYYELFFEIASQYIISGHTTIFVFAGLKNPSCPN